MVAAVKVCNFQQLAKFAQLMDLQYIQIIYIDERMHLCSQKEKEQALA